MTGLKTADSTTTIDLSDRKQACIEIKDWDVHAVTIIEKMQDGSHQMRLDQTEIDELVMHLVGMRG